MSSETTDTQGAGEPPASCFDPLPLIFLLILGSLWGLSFSLSKLAVVGGVLPVAYLWMQSTGAALFLALVCRVLRVPIPFGRREIIFYLATGLLGMVLPSLNIVTTAKYLPAGLLSTVVTTVPVITYLAVLALRQERFNPVRATGIALGMIGVLFLLLPDSSLPDPSMTPWLLMSLLTPVFYAANSILSARMRPEGLHSLAAAFGMTATASAASLPIMLATNSFHPLFAHGPTVTDMAMAGQIAVSCVAYIFYFEIIRRAGAVYISQVSYVVTITGLIWGYIVFTEIPTAWLYAAVAFVFVGVALVNRRTQRAGSAPAKR